jgi:flagellar motor protein MotB
MTHQRGSLSSATVTPRSSARRWRFTSGFLFFGTLTVVAGYYVPLRREAGRLRAEGDSLRAELSQARAQLTESLARPPEAPPAAGAAPNSGDVEARARARIERLDARLRERFGELARSQKLSVASAGERMSVAIANEQLFSGSSLDVSSSGRALLCDLAQTVMAEFDGQLRITGYYGKPRIVEPALSRRYASPWELSAARAARAVDVLVRDCRAPAERFLAVGYGPRAAGPLGENIAFEFIFTDPS